MWSSCRFFYRTDTAWRPWLLYKILSIRKQPHSHSLFTQRLEFTQTKHMEIGGDKTFLLLCTSEKIFDTESNAWKSSTTVCLNFSKRRFRAEQGKSEEDFKKLTHSYVTSRPYFATSQLSNVLVFPVFPLKLSTLIATNWSNSRCTLTSWRTCALKSAT